MAMFMWAFDFYGLVRTVPALKLNLNPVMTPVSTAYSVVKWPVGLTGGWIELANIRIPYVVPPPVSLPALHVLIIQ